MSDCSVGKCFHDWNKEMLEHLQSDGWIDYLDASLSLVYTQESEMMLPGRVKYYSSTWPLQTHG